MGKASIAVEPEATSPGLSTGSTLLNLALTDDASYGIEKGQYVFFVGDSQSGKTFFSMAEFAEATMNPAFDNYRLIYDDIEGGMHMDTDRLFNEAVADRIEPPGGDKDNPVPSATIEDFYFHLDDALYEAGWDSRKRRRSDVEEPRPFIYVLDSMDGLTSESSDDKFHKTKNAARKKKSGDDDDDEKVAGSYGDGKAKKNSENIRRALRGLRETGSILIVISQTRDNPAAQYAGTKTRSGGHALKFYAHSEIWTSIQSPIVRTVNNIPRNVGNTIRIDVKKNRGTGKLNRVEIDIYPSFGIDDLGDCVDYLVKEGVVKKKEGGEKLVADALKLVGSRDKIIREIEKQGLQARLRELCQACWADVQAACSLQRQSRYARSE